MRVDILEKEYTFVMIRPGALRRKKVIYIMNYIREINLTIEVYKLKELTPQFIMGHYKHLICDDIPYDIFERTMIENLSGEVIGMIVSGKNAIKEMRILIGPSNIKKAKDEFPNSIRSLGDINNNADNLIHASDSVESAMNEIQNFFGIILNQTTESIDQNVLKLKKSPIHK